MMKNPVMKIKKLSTTGFIGIEATIIAALFIVFSMIVYQFLRPSFDDIAIAIRDSVSGTY